MSSPLGNDDGNDNKTSTLSDHATAALNSVTNFFANIFPATTSTTPAPDDTYPNQTVSAGGRKSRKGKSRKGKSRRGKSRKCSKCTRARKCARCRKSSRR